MYLEEKPVDGSASFYLVRPACRTYLRVKVPYAPDKGKH